MRNKATHWVAFLLNSNSYCLYKQEYLTSVLIFNYELLICVEERHALVISAMILEEILLTKFLEIVNYFKNNE